MKTCACGWICNEFIKQKITMRQTRYIFVIFAIVFLWEFTPTTSCSAESWYAGRWDSCLYQAANHPHTIALRIEVEDVDTGLPLDGVQVSLEGEWEEEQTFGSSITRDFKLIAKTDSGGIVVFALTWHGPNRPGPDDIEKAQRVTAKRGGYGHQSKRLNFTALIYGNDDYNKDVWMDMISQTDGAKYFVMLLGEDFKKYEQESCTAIEFFKKVRGEDYGKVFRAREKTEADFPGYFIMALPQKESGPFMMFPVSFSMKRIYQEHQVRIEGDKKVSWIENDDSSQGGGEETDQEVEPEEELESPQGKTRIGNGYITQNAYDNIENYINKGMTPQEIVGVLGESMNTWASAANNTMMSWHVWQSGGRRSVWIVINPEGKVTRIEKD